MCNNKLSVDMLIQLFKGVNLPKNRLIFMHVRLKEISKSYGGDYIKATQDLIEAVKFFSPKSILIPVFTYSFTKNGVFHKDFSYSETGRFSEEARKIYPFSRTLDPIFSILDIFNWLESKNNVNYLTAFGSSSVWQHLLEENCIILNVGIEDFVATQVHYLEKLSKAPYRENIYKRGVMCVKNTACKEVKYKFYARNLEQNRLLNWPKIEKTLLKEKSLVQKKDKGIKISWIGSQEFHETLQNELNKDPYFLVS
jgi:aminoglycoside N3'-acetyltransferase